MDEKILTLHPAGKAGVNISRSKYDVILDAIIESLRAGGELTFGGLTDAVREKLVDSFDGSISWYVTTVKLDAEARGLIERVPKSRLQRLRLISA